MILDHLINSIQSINTGLRNAAAKAINSSIGQPVVAKLQNTGNEADRIWQPVVAKSNDEERHRMYDDLISPERVFNSLSYSHHIQLLKSPSKETLLQWLKENNKGGSKR